MAIEYDYQGRPYIMSGARRVYISPVAFGGQAPEDKTGMFRSRPQWNQNTGRWETPLDFGNIMSIGTGAALGAGALSALGAFGGAAGAGGGAGGAAAGGVLPSTAIGTGAVPGIAGGSGLAGAAGFGGAGVGAGTAGASAATAGASSVLPGVGIGETGAVTGLAGSGFGAGGAGGILSALGKFGGVAGEIGDVLTSGARGSAQERGLEDWLDLQAAGTNNRAMVDAAQFNLDAPFTRAQQVARGDLMAADIPRATAIGGGRDLSFQGGLGPDSFGPNTTAAGQTLSSQALQALQSQSDRLTPQQVTPRRSGLGENVTAGAGTGLSILGILSRIFRRR